MRPSMQPLLYGARQESNQRCVSRLITGARAAARSLLCGGDRVPVGCVASERTASCVQVGALGACVHRLGAGEKNGGG